MAADKVSAMRELLMALEASAGKYKAWGLGSWCSAMEQARSDSLMRKERLMALARLTINAVDRWRALKSREGFSRWSGFLAEQDMDKVQAKLRRVRIQGTAGILLGVFLTLTSTLPLTRNPYFPTP